MENERSALTEGYLVYPKSLAVNVDSTIDLVATIYSPSAFDHARSARQIAGAPWSISTSMEIGGNIRARLIADLPGTVSPQSNNVQPVVGAGDAASWRWQIKPSRDGNFTLTMTFNVLRGNTTELLTSDTTFTTSLVANQTAGHLAGSIWQSVVDFLKSLGGILSALGITAGATIFWLVRRFNPRPPSRPLTPAMARASRAERQSRKRAASEN
jgi:hypothetical protein